MENAKALAQKMAQTNLPILITGESGTGKELFAQAIHNSSPRREEPFIAVNCATIPDSLLESELFGYEEGAFTGAGRNRMHEFKPSSQTFEGYTRKRNYAIRQS